MEDDAAIEIVSEAPRAQGINWSNAQQKVCGGARSKCMQGSRPGSKSTGKGIRARAFPLQPPNKPKNITAKAAKKTFLNLCALRVLRGSISTAHG